MQISVAGHPVYAYTGSRAPDPSLPTVVFIHGAANDHSVWALQSRYFAWHGRNVVAIDLPGHGRSGGHALASVEAIAGWVIALLDAAGVNSAALCGHSLGSLVALECAARHPARIGRIALLGAAAPMTVSDELLACAKAGDHAALEMINSWSYSAGNQLGGNAVPGMWMTGNGLRLMERAAPGVLYTDLAACHAYADGLAAAARCRCPALLILGSRDIMAPPRNAAALIEALPQHKKVTLPGCGHASMAEAPDAVLDALRSFL
jgi:pimeloyl-ACP methyl ester carboxylesterase